MKAAQCTLLLFAAGVLGCTPSDQAVANGDDPLRSLTAPVLSDRYGTPYWTEKSARDPELWAKALDYCRDRADAEHPNCEVVRDVDRLDRASQLPPDRPNNFRLTVPYAGEPNDAPTRP